MTESPKRHNYRTLYLGANLIAEVIQHLKDTSGPGEMARSFSEFAREAVWEKLGKEQVVLQKLEREASDASK